MTYVEILRRIIVRTERRLILLTPQQIDWVEANGNYVKIHAGSEEHVMRTTLQKFSEQLTDYPFVQIHRSVIVNVEKVASLQWWRAGEFLVCLLSGRELTLTRKHREHFFKTIGIRSPGRTLAQ